MTVNILSLDCTWSNKKGFTLTDKLPPDERLQVQEDVLPDTHFHLIRGKVSFKIMSAFSLQDTCRWNSAGIINAV